MKIQNSRGLKKNMPLDSDKFIKWPIIGAIELDINFNTMGERQFTVLLGEYSWASGLLCVRSWLICDVMDCPLLAQCTNCAQPLPTSICTSYPLDYI